MNKLPRWMTVLWTVALLALILGGVWFYKAQKHAARQEAVNHLSSIARLKADEIAAWRRKCLDEGAELMQRPTLAQRIARWMENPQRQQPQDLLEEFRVLQKYNTYSDVMLVDPSGNLLLSLKARGETVLVVEDEASILKLAEQILERLGYSVLTASTPNDAIARAETHAGRIDLLITDVVMPEMNGRELAHRLQALYPGLKCLFMSGYTSNVIAHRGVLEEGVDFIQKPFSKKDLAIKVRKTLDWIEEQPQQHT